ncbi:O-antigen/teichoic acid export membrane protein [Yoonia maricola]|uniref:O-antigen/teichoic acid export membrane protein n=2 Tax=Yoonia maricola TaxID=420999 RepID=A0A2M8W0D9_9RHOB|nr:O-antigen/teichoic acid export membrane protein [Yoonia maricola]
MVLALKGGEALIGAAMTIYLARIMGPASFGVFAFGLATTTLLAIPIKNGASTLITKHVAIAHDGEGQHMAGPLVVTGIGMSLLYAGFILAGLWGAVSFRIDSPFLAAAAITALALPFLCLTGLWEGVLRGSFRPNTAILVGTILLPFGMLVLGVALTTQLTTQGWRLAGAIYIGVAMAVSLLALILARPHLQDLLAKPEQRVLMVPTVWIGHAVPFAVVTGLLIFNRQIDVILLATLRSEEAAGIYRIAAQAAVLVTFGVQAIGHLYAPYLAQTKEAAAPDTLSAYLRRSVRFSLGYGFLALGALAIWGDDIIATLAGAAYLPGYPIMLILCAANLAVALNGATMQALFMQGHQTKVVWVFAAAGVFSVIANVVLIPLLGLYGAAIATSCAIVIWSLGLRVMACRIWGLSFVSLRPVSAIPATKC